jgi:hypothetical protein
MLVSQIIEMILQVFHLKASSDLRDNNPHCEFELTLEDNLILVIYKGVELLLWVNPKKDVPWHTQKLQSLMDAKDRRDEILDFMKKWSMGRGVPNASEDGETGWVRYEGLNVPFKEGSSFDWALEAKKKEEAALQERLEQLRKESEEFNKKKEFANNTLKHTNEGFTVQLMEDFTGRHDMCEGVVNITNLPDCKYRHMHVKVRMLAKQKNGVWMAEYIGIP